MLGFIYSPLIDSVIDDKKGFLAITPKRPWLMNIPEKFVRTKDDGTRITSAELSVAYYFKWANPHIQLDLLSPHETSYDDLDKYDLVFVFNHTKGDAYLFDNYVHYKHLKNLLTHPAIYPPKDWSDVVDHKHHMYKFLKNNGIPVLPLHHIVTESYKNDPSTEFIKLRQFIQDNHVTKFFLRPEFGTCSVDISSYDADVLYNLKEWKAIEEIMFKYPGIFITPYCKGFQTFGEYKCYFYNDEPFCILQYDCDDNELYSYDINSPHVKSYLDLAKRTYNTFQKFYIKGCGVQRIFTRIDMSSTDNGKLFVNEIEAAPGFYDFDEGIDKYYYDEKAMYLDKYAGKAMMDVFIQYNQCMLHKKRTMLYLKLITASLFISIIVAIVIVSYVQIR